VDVDAIAAQLGIALDIEHHIQIACRRTPLAGIALAAHPQARTGINTRWDVDP